MFIVLSKYVLVNLLDVKIASHIFHSECALVGLFVVAGVDISL